MESFDLYSMIVHVAGAIESMFVDAFCTDCDCRSRLALMDCWLLHSVAEVVYALLKRVPQDDETIIPHWAKSNVQLNHLP
mgnify:CR=1 FL=1